MTTRVAGGLLLGHDPINAGQGLKPLAFASFRPYGRLARGQPARRACAGLFPAERVLVLLDAELVEGDVRSFLLPDALRDRGLVQADGRDAVAPLPRTSCSRTCISGWHACRT